MVQERVSLVSNTLPSWCSPPVLVPPLSATSRMMKIGITSEKLSVIDLSMITYWTIRQRLLIATLFSTLALRFTPIYFNREYARAHDHPGVVVDPLLVLCTVMGLSVEDLSEAGGPFLGVEAVEFHRPVYPGDTLTARSTVVSRRESEKRPEFGVVTWRTRGSNQKGEVVVSYRRSNLVARRRRASA